MITRFLIAKEPSLCNQKNRPFAIIFAFRFPSISVRVADCFVAVLHPLHAKVMSLPVGGILQADGNQH